MDLITDIRKTVVESTPVYAVVGATDYAVARVRAAAGSASALQAEVEKTVAALEPLPAALQARAQKVLDPKTLNGAVQQLPALAVARALEVASQVEARYDVFAERGKELVDRLLAQQATQDLITQGKATLSRTKAAVTTARKAVDETASAARGVVAAGRREGRDVATEVERSVAQTEQVVQARTADTQAAVKQAEATARSRVAATRTATKAAVTSARKTAAKASHAAAEAVDKLGD
jgi:hypothetical protein